jgi:hypothetical protein
MLFPGNGISQGVVARGRMCIAWDLKNALGIDSAYPGNFLIHGNGRYRSDLVTADTLTSTDDGQFVILRGHYGVHNPGSST